nr:astacin-like metalloprotease toxin 5 [Parasteatoda tepidariorum]
MIPSVCILAVLIVTAFGDNAEESRLAMQNPDLFEGDIIGIDLTDRNAIPHKAKRWPNKKVPYIIEGSLWDKKNLILDAMDDFNMNTCLKFVPRTTEKNYVKLLAGNGCYSQVGMNDRGEQQVSLGKGCDHKGVVVHELGHTIGFFHEHNRSDRDTYLIIYWQNIKEGMAPQFTKLDAHQNIIYNKFDHDSIMMYGNFAWSKDGKQKTMISMNGKKLLEIKDKKGLTASDIQRINKMYNC